MKIVYFSARGGTRRIAKILGEHLQVPVVELVADVPYQEMDLDWRNEHSRVSRENAGDEHPAFHLVDECNSGDCEDENQILLLGYPIWFGKAPVLVYDWLKQESRDGCTIIPFCVSGGSGILYSQQDLERAFPTINWKQGRRFSARAAEKEVVEWSEKLERYKD